MKIGLATGNNIIHFDRNTNSGFLSNKIVLNDKINLDGVVNVIFSPKGDNIYAAAKDSDSIVYWKRNVLLPCENQDVLRV